MIQASGEDEAGRMVAVTERELTERLRGCLMRRAGVLAGNGVRSASLVGSVARGEVRPESDVDLLLELAPDAAFDLVDLVELKDALGAELDRPVDILFKGSLRTYVAETVERDALRLI
jgi:uncharacterized protein